MCPDLFSSTIESITSYCSTSTAEDESDGTGILYLSNKQGSSNRINPYRLANLKILCSYLLKICRHNKHYCRTTMTAHVY